MADSDEEKPDEREGDSFGDAFPRTPASFFRPGEKERPPPAPGLEAGKVVGDFRLVALIGQGGMGQVWEAEQVSLGGRRVAVKFVRPERVTQKQLAYFEREARAGGRLSHPGIVAVHGYGESSDLAWIAMELVEGTWTLRDSLDELVREHEVPADYDQHVARFVRDLARAMHAAHEGGVIHRDLKPQNILITPDNRPKVTDFGLARLTDESALSATGEFAGTYFYMSPEQVAAKRMGIDHRTDIFSLGVVLYEMLALVRPFQGDTSHQVAAQIVTKDPPDPRTIRSRISRDLVVITGKALEKDRDQRYATMGELADDLERFLSDEPILAKPPSRTQRLVKWVRRNPAKSLGGAVAAVAFVIISCLLVWIGGQNTTLKAMTQDVFRLSLSQDYKDLMAEEEELWPVSPDKTDAYEKWIDTANNLVKELPKLRANREELRRGALPWTEEERRADRESHPDFGRLKALAAEIESMRLALAVRRGLAEPELPSVDWGEYPEDASGLNGVAWPLIDPERESFGRERLGLVLAEKAMEVAPPEEKAGIWDTVAWGRFAVGNDPGALEASRSALEAASEAQRGNFKGYLAKLETSVEKARRDSGLAEAESEIARLEKDRAALEARVDKRRIWTFPEEESSSGASWWNEQLTELIGELESLMAPGMGLLVGDGVSAERRWSMPRRLALARRFDTGGDLCSRWEQVLPAINAAYPGLELSLQTGLVPIGPDPDSGLREFWHVYSGEEPIRDEEGELTMYENSGLVFVLLPGGRFWMGAQKEDPNGQNYDPDAQSNEGPVHKVELSAFFLSKFEMTLGQWELLSGELLEGRNPDSWEWGKSSPVVRVGWYDCSRLLSKFRLCLPSEAQWEYAARGGTSTVWWTGSDPESLVAVGAKKRDLQGREIYFPGKLAPVGTYSANGFGLHEVCGNVKEWCADGYDRGFYARSYERDPLSPATGPADRVYRGGGSLSDAVRGRSAFRYFASPEHLGCGLRPARAID